MICLNCFAKSLLQRQSSSDCTEQCLLEGSPAGVLEYGSNRTIALLAPSSRLAPLHDQTVRVTGIVVGPAVANNGAILVQSLQVLQQAGDGTQWVEHQIQ